MIREIWKKERKKDKGNFERKKDMIREIWKKKERNDKGKKERKIW